MAKKAATSEETTSNEPSSMEILETVQEAINGIKEEVSTLVQEKVEVLEMKVDDKLTMIQEKFNSANTPKEFEQFIRSAKIAGEINKVELFSMVFAAILSGTVSNPHSALFKFTNTEAGKQNREHEVIKILNTVDLVASALENYFQAD